MRGLTKEEYGLLRQITIRLEKIPSAVVRSHLLLHTAQLIDFVVLGGTDQARERQLVGQVDELQNKLDELIGADSCGEDDD